MDIHPLIRHSLLVAYTKTVNILSKNCVSLFALTEFFTVLSITKLSVGCPTCLPPSNCYGIANTQNKTEPSEKTSRIKVLRKKEPSSTLSFPKPTIVNKK